MNIALITGSCGLVGSESSIFFAKKKFKILGIDNNSRKFFFGKDGDISWVKKNLKKNIKTYNHLNIDIRNIKSLKSVFLRYKKNIKIIIHAAAQPSHDWAKNKPFVDFDINARGTLNLLELTKLYCPDVPFIFMSTNKAILIVFWCIYADLIVDIEKCWFTCFREGYITGPSFWSKYMVFLKKPH